MTIHPTTTARCDEHDCPATVTLPTDDEPQVVALLFPLGWHVSYQHSVLLAPRQYMHTLCPDHAPAR